MKNQFFYFSALLILIAISFTNSTTAQTMGEDYVIFEAEQTSSPLGEWQIRRPGDALYLNNGALAPINDTHLEFTGNNPSIGDPNSPLVYKFTCPKTGAYKLGMRLYQRLEGQPQDKCNDVYIKMAGDFTSASADFTTTILKNYMKFYGRGVDKWGASTAGESHVNGVKVQQAVLYNLKAGEEYTFTMAGRAQRTNIDYFIFFEKSLNLTVKNHFDLAASNDAKYRPTIKESCKTFNAVDMKYQGIEGFTDALTDNKETLKILQIKDRLAWAAAQMTYHGTNGQATFTLNTMQETDGESSYKLRINGVLIKEVTNDKIHGTAIPDYTIQKHLLNETPVTLNNGDLIQIEFSNATNGLVPEGDQGLTATSRGRWLSLDICTTGQFEDFNIKLKKKTLNLLINKTEDLDIDIKLPPGTQESIEWKSLTPAIATVDQNGLVEAVAVGSVKIVVLNTGTNYTDTCEVLVYDPQPYNGVTATIPGKIEMENFDTGGEGISYHDKTTGNSGRSYRADENVDIQPSADGGFLVGWIDEGEWLQYTVDITKSDIYDINIMAASIVGIDFKIEIDGVDITGNTNFPATGGMETFENYTIEDVSITEGNKTLKFIANASNMKINWIEFAEQPIYYPVESVAITADDFSIDVDAIKIVLAKVTPTTATDKEIVWTSEDPTIATVGSSGMVKGKANGVTKIIAHTSNPLVSDTIIVTVGTGNATAISNDRTNTKIAAYPNPFSNQLIVEANNSIKSISIYDNVGKLMYSASYNNVTDTSVELNLSYSILPKGIYHVKVIDLQNTNSFKVIRE